MWDIRTTLSHEQCKVSKRESGESEHPSGRASGPVLVKVLITDLAFPLRGPLSAHSAALTAVRTRQIPARRCASALWTYGRPDGRRDGLKANMFC